MASDADKSIPEIIPFPIFGYLAFIDFILFMIKIKGYEVDQLF